jgi:hypothetical protein
LKSNSELFLISALTLESAFHDLPFIKQWIKEQNEKISVRINKVPFSALKNWHFSTDNSELVAKAESFISCSKRSSQKGQIYDLF